MGRCVKRVDQCGTEQPYVENLTTVSLHIDKANQNLQGTADSRVENRKPAFVGIIGAIRFKMARPMGRHPAQHTMSCDFDVPDANH